MPACLPACSTPACPTSLPAPLPACDAGGPRPSAGLHHAPERAGGSACAAPLRLSCTILPGPARPCPCWSSYDHPSTHTHPHMRICRAHDHPPLQPYNASDDMLRATTMEIISTLKELLHMHPLYNEQMRNFIQVGWGQGWGVSVWWVGRCCLVPANAWLLPLLHAASSQPLRHCSHPTPTRTTHTPPLLHLASSFLPFLPSPCFPLSLALTSTTCPAWQTWPPA